MISLFVGGWIALECTGALLDLIRTGAFEFPKWLTRSGWQFGPLLLDYASRPVATVFVAAVAVIFGFLGYCAMIFGITDLWQRFAASAGPIRIDPPK